MIESSAKTNKMKYEINSRILKDRDSGYLGKLLSNIKQQIFDIILTNLDYMIVRHNLLKNDGIVEYDKKRSNYPSRSRKT